MAAYMSLPALDPPAGASSSYIATIQTHPKSATSKPTMLCLGALCSAAPSGKPCMQGRASALLVLWGCSPAAANTAPAQLSLQVSCKLSQTLTGTGRLPPVSVCDSSSMVAVPVVSPGIMHSKLMLCARAPGSASATPGQCAHKHAPCKKPEDMLCFYVNRYAAIRHMRRARPPA